MIWQRRRELERRLNNEAAVRLATLSLELGLLAVDLRDPVAATRLTRLQDEVRVILEELREVGSELYPAVLCGSGVVAALRTFAERRKLALSVRMDRADAEPSRYPTQVEAELYFAIADAVDSLAGPAAGGRPISVDICRSGDDLVATVTGAGTREMRFHHPLTGGC